MFLPHDSAQPGARPQRRAEIVQILKLAVPLIIAHVAMIGMEIIDTVMAGRFSVEDLAGLAVGGNIWLIIEVCMGGFLSALTPRLARFYGAGQHREIIHETQQGLLLGGLTGLLAMAVMLATLPWIPLLGTEPAVTLVARGYIEVIAYSIPASAICWVLFCLIESHGLMRFVVGSSLVMLGLGAGQATAIRVAHSLGRAQAHAQDRAVYRHIEGGLNLVVVVGAMAGIGVFAWREQLPLLFTESPGIAAISSTIMSLAPLYLVCDALQV